MLRYAAQTISCLMIMLMTCRFFIRIRTINEVPVQFNMSLLLYSHNIPKRGYIDAQNMA